MPSFFLSFLFLYSHLPSTLHYSSMSHSFSLFIRSAVLLCCLSSFPLFYLHLSTPLSFPILLCPPRSSSHLLSPLLSSPLLSYLAEARSWPGPGLSPLFSPGLPLHLLRAQWSFFDHYRSGQCGSKAACSSGWGEVGGERGCSSVRCSIVFKEKTERKSREMRKTYLYG